MIQNPVLYKKGIYFRQLFRLLRFDRSYILRKFCLIVLPEDKLTRISRKFGIQPLNDLF